MTSPRDAQVGGDHYRCLPIQPVDIIHANGLGFIEGSVIKYVCRHRSKGDNRDLLEKFSGAFPPVILGYF